jgi:hypothetical protein
MVSNMLFLARADRGMFELQVESRPAGGGEQSPNFSRSPPQKTA